MSTILCLHPYVCNNYMCSAIYVIQSYVCTPMSELLCLYSYVCSPIHVVLYLQSYTYNPILALLYLYFYTYIPIRLLLSAGSSSPSLSSQLMNSLPLSLRPKNIRKQHVSNCRKYKETRCSNLPENTRKQGV